MSAASDATRVAPRLVLEASPSFIYRRRKALGVTLLALIAIALIVTGYKLPHRYARAAPYLIGLGVTLGFLEALIVGIKNATRPDKQSFRVTVASWNITRKIEEDALHKGSTLKVGHNELAKTRISFTQQLKEEHSILCVQGTGFEDGDGYLKAITKEDYAIHSHLEEDGTLTAVLYSTQYRLLGHQEGSHSTSVLLQDPVTKIKMLVSSLLSDSVSDFASASADFCLVGVENAKPPVIPGFQRDEEDRSPTSKNGKSNFIFASCNTQITRSNPFNADTDRLAEGYPHTPTAATITLSELLTS